MKKIFYFLASAIVALGAMACQNEVDENINPNTQSDVVSFTVAFDEATRIAMSIEDKTAKFAFEAGDKLYVQPYAMLENDEVFEGNTYEFTTEDGETFSCQSAELVSELAQSGNYAFVGHSADGSIRSNEGVDGFNFATYADLTAEPVVLKMSHAVFHFTVPEGTTATLKHTEDIFYTDAVVGWEKEITFTEGEHWVAAWALSGTLSYSINGVVVKSITKDFEAGKIYNLGTLNTNMTIANVAALIEKAAAGSTITLPAGATITGSEILTIDKNITINGNGATFTSTAGRAINIDTNGEVNISNLTINCTQERVFNIINQPATVNISGVTATAANYAIMVATSAGAATVNVENSTLTGMNVVNVAGEDAQVTVTNCTLNCNDNSNVEAYAALALYNTAEGAKITATGCTINVNGDSYEAWNSSKTGTITISDGEVVNAIAYIDYNNGYSYSFSSLAKAIKTAKGDDVIVLLQNAEIDQVGTFNIDVNGCTLTPAEGTKLTIEGTTVTVAEKQAYKVYVLDQGNWTEAIHSWNDKGDITGNWGNTTFTKTATVNGMSFKYYEYNKSYDGQSVNYILFNKNDDFFRAQYDNVVLDSDKYYRINAVGEVIEIDPNDLSTYKFALYIYDQNGVNSTHTLYYAATATGTGVAQTAKKDYNWKAYHQFVLDGNKIGTNFVVSIASQYNDATKSINNLSISKDIKTDLCIGYWNNNGNAGYWANGTTPYTSLLNN